MRRGILFAVVALALLLCGMTVEVRAQVSLSTESAATDVPALPDPLTPEAVNELVSRLSDAEVRALLLDRLDAVAEAQDAAQDITAAETLGGALAGAVDSIRVAFVRAPEVLDGVARGFANFFAPRGWGGVGTVVGWTLLALALGYLAERIVIRVSEGLRKDAVPVWPESLGETLVMLVKRAVFEGAGLVAFYYVTMGVLDAALSDVAPPRVPGGDGVPGIRHAPDALIATTFVSALVMWPRFFLLIFRFVLAPYKPHLRLLSVDDATARFIYRQSTIVFALWGTTGFLIPFLATHGILIGQLRLGFWINILAYGTLLYTTWRAREGITRMMLGHDEDVTPGEAAFARLYPWLGMGVIVLVWLLVEAIVAQRLWHLLDGRQIVTLLLLLFAPTFDTAVRGIVRRTTRPPTGEGVVARTAHLRAKRSYIRIGRVIAGVGVVLVIARLWGIDLTNLAAAGVGFRIAGRLIEGIVIALAGYLLWEVSSLWINRKLAAERTAMGFDSADESMGDEGGTGVSRLATVLPLLLGVLKVTIAVIFGLIVIGNFGVDTTPLLAGAGIVGLAIGFGAQKLVADIVSGIFFLVDDAFRSGEYLDVDGTMGTVEQISVRSMQLRHHKGAVHTIPYGEIPKITNYSRDWVIMKLKFTVPFDTDPNKVKKIFKKIGAEMMQVPEYAEDFLQPFKSQGVFDFDDVGMIIRGKFMAKPGRQFVLRKEVYNRVIKAFDEAGISFARREVRVAIPGIEGAALNEEQRDAVAAAASEAADSVPPPATGDDR